MKQLLSSLFFLTILFAIGCKKDPPEAILPEDVEFGKSVIYLNGEEVDYVAVLENDTFNHLMNYGFSQEKGNIFNLLSFGRMPLSTGGFQLTTENILYEKARTSFNQIVDKDLDGYEYELEDVDDGFLNIEYFDSIKMEVKGRFKAKFRRTAKNGVDGDLPKHLVLQGVFYDKYVRH